MKNKIGIRNWISIIIIGFAGQLAWAIENMYLNKFIFYLNTDGGNSYLTYISLTVAFSAITACLTTILMGALSDKLNKRKIFISVGYILWGLSTASFGLINKENIATLFPLANVSMLSGIFVILLDCLMTFFGSSANDASFNSYITKNINSKNRGKVEGVLSILPLIAMLVIFVGLNFLTDEGKWDIFFYIIGGIVLLIGIISIFLLPKDNEIKQDRSYLKLLTNGFKIKTIRENKNLYIILIAYMIYGVATQIFFPYLMIYFEYALGFEGFDFSLVLGIVLIVGSILSVIYGYLIDRFNKKTLLIPIILLFILGLFLLYFVKKGDLVFAIISGIIMMFGYISVGTILNSFVRDLIPKGEEGSFMGIRMLFVVAIPMCSGPFIGEAISKALPGGIYVDLGIEKILPSNFIWMMSLIVLLLIFIPIIFFLINKDEKNKNRGILFKNKNYKLIEDPLKEYPRPNFIRNSYLNLNGRWDIEISKNDDLIDNFHKSCIVPFAIETPLSDVNHLLEVDEYIQYHKEIELPKNFNKGRLILHLEGVDQISKIYINKRLIDTHISGYLRNELDITPFIKENKFRLDIVVSDKTDTNSLSRGKQKLDRGGIYYTSSSGIYKPVWIESTPSKFIKSVKITPLFDNNAIKIIINSNVDEKCDVSFLDYHFNLETNKEIILKDLNLPIWDINNPNLIDVKINMLKDIVYTYFGFRKIEIKDDSIYLNNKKIFINGLLDQGYYFLGGLTPKNYQDYLDDINLIKELGFNTIRVHIKKELDMFYYYCDLNGILVIQDFVNGGDKYKTFTTIRGGLFPFWKKKDDSIYKSFSRTDELGRNEFNEIINSWINELYNYPSIIMYTIFNEGWGQFDSKIIYDKAKKLDASRIYDVASGWYDNGFNEIKSMHSYFYPLKIKKDGRPFLFTEFGGYSFLDKEHFYGTKNFGYRRFKNKSSFKKAYIKLYKKKIIPLIDKGLNGIIYTQFNDCEDETNGLLTFDRVLKIDKETILEINEEISNKNN